MKGVPKHDLSSKHGTNANFKKTGPPLMKNLKNMAGNFIKGQGPLGFMNPVGAIANRIGAFGGNQPTQAPQQDQQVPNPNPPVQQVPNPNPPVQPMEPTPTPTAGAVAGESAPTMMKKGAPAIWPFKKKVKTSGAVLDRERKKKARRKKIKTSNNKLRNAFNEITKKISDNIQEPGKKGNRPGFD